MPPTPAPTENPILARHLDWLAEVGEMTMSLTRKAHACAEAQLEEPDPETPQPKSPDYALRFTGLVNALQRIIAVEARTAAGDRPAQSTGPKRTASTSDPRYTLIRDALHKAVRSDPGRAKLCRAIDQELDNELTADPAHTIPIGIVLVTIADRLDIHLDVTRLPDALLVTELPTDAPQDTGQSYTHRRSTGPPS